MVAMLGLMLPIPFLPVRMHSDRGRCCNDGSWWHSTSHALLCMVWCRRGDVPRVPSVVRWRLTCTRSLGHFAGERTSEPGLGRDRSRPRLGLGQDRSVSRLGLGQDGSIPRLGLGRDGGRPTAVRGLAWSRASRCHSVFRLRFSSVLLRHFSGAHFHSSRWFGDWGCYDLNLGTMVYGTRQKCYTVQILNLRDEFFESN